MLTYVDVGQVNFVVKQLKGKESYPIQAKLSDSLFSIKQKLAALTKSKPEDQRLLLKGKALPDLKTLEDAGIKEGSVLHLSLKVSATTSAEARSEPSTSTSGTYNTVKRALEEKSGDHIFWKDLKALLQSHLVNEDQVNQVYKEFQKSYQSLIEKSGE
jgi:hypothetical protein